MVEHSPKILASEEKATTITTTTAIPAKTTKPVKRRHLKKIYLFGRGLPEMGGRGSINS